MRTDETMIKYIESSSNEIYKNTKKLLMSKERKKASLFITEGYRSVCDSIKHNADIRYIIISEKYDLECFEDKFTVYKMSEKLFREISSTVNSQGILAVVGFVHNADSDFKYDNSKTLVYLDSVTDPGNMGTILRTSDAMGVDGVILSKGCVDLYNPKVVRATMASIFNVPIYLDEDYKLLKKLKQNGYLILGTFLDADVYSYDADFTKKTVIVMGNEANGISNELEKLCDIRVKVPMKGNAESLNVATCCAMVLYENMRQN